MEEKALAALVTGWIQLCLNRLNELHKVGRVILMVVVSMLPHAEIGRNEHRENAPHFIGNTSGVFQNCATKVEGSYPYVKKLIGKSWFHFDAGRNRLSASFPNNSDSGSVP